jgi:hypothetical protein
MVVVHPCQLPELNYLDMDWMVSCGLAIPSEFYVIVLPWLHLEEVW